MSLLQVWINLRSIEKSRDTKYCSSVRYFKQTGVSPLSSWIWSSKQSAKGWPSFPLHLLSIKERRKNVFLILFYNVGNIPLRCMVIRAQKMFYFEVQVSVYKILSAFLTKLTRKIHSPKTTSAPLNKMAKNSRFLDKFPLLSLILTRTKQKHTEKSLSQSSFHLFDKKT